MTSILCDNLPTHPLYRWVAPLQGCQKDVDFFFGNAKQIEGKRLVSLYT